MTVDIQVHVYHETRQLLKMPKRLVNREELDKLIAKISDVITMINESAVS
jgi:hypothetical protein